MNQKKTDKPIVIVGAGISGLTLSILLKQHGKKVIVIEKRSPYQPNDPEDARSFNLTITERGMKSFRSIGIEKKILKHSVPLKSRIIHYPADCACQEEQSRQFYGSEANDMIFSIPRTELIHILYKEAEKNKNSEIKFDTELVEINKNSSSAVFRSHNTGEETTIKYEFLIGADGAYSKVRQYILLGEVVDFQINYFNWFYKKFIISADDGKALNMDPLALHVFPKKEALIVAIPNRDESFSCIYCTNIEDSSDFKSDLVNKDFQQKFQNHFPHICRLSEKLRQTFISSKISGLVNIQLSKWRYEDKMVLVGDAAHAVFPFYGQGMNAALQDCRNLVSCIAKHKSLNEAFIEYENVQKQSTKALSALCREHFSYLQENCTSSLTQAQLKIDRILGKIKPDFWISEYRLVAQTELPYNEILERLSRQECFRKIFGIVLADYFLAGIIMVTRKFLSFFSFKRA